MKRSVKNLFIVILMVISFIASAIGVTPAHAASSMEIVPLLLPGGWLSGNLNGIWGSSASDIYAVGYGNNGIATVPLVYHNNGSGWSESGLPLPAGWRSAYLYGVWGSSATDVYVVGSGNSYIGHIPLVYHKDSTGWVATSVPLRTGIGSGYLYSIWGSGPNDVYAAGYGYSGNIVLPLLYHNNGSGWIDITPSMPVGWSSVDFKGLWGSSNTNVYAVGHGNDGSKLLPVLYQGSVNGWSATTFSLQSGWLSGYLYDVWGSTATNVYAVGYGNNGNIVTPLVYQNNGNGWVDSTPSLPTGWEAGYLYGIWGPAVTDVIDVYAVGSGRNGSTLLPLLYHNEGNGWSEESPALPSGWSFAYLQDVWGSSTSDVYVVGTGNNGSANLPLLYHSSQVEQDLVPPADVDNATFTAVEGTTNGSVKLNWTAPADDDGGTVSAYLVKYSTSQFNNWSEGIPVITGIPTPNPPGSTETMTISGLAPGKVYYFAIRAQDEQYNLSANYATASAKSSNIGGVGTWYIAGIGNFIFGANGDIPVVADYNGDRRADMAVFRPSNSTWYIYGVGAFLFGTVGDIPVIADYNGDSRADIAVYRPSTSTWYIYGMGSFVFGASGDIPVVADYNGDGRADVAVFRPSEGTWYIAGVGNFSFGGSGDIPVVGDYNGDGRADMAIFRPSESAWYIAGVGPTPFGGSGDIPVVADYNGDGRADMAIFRPSESAWYIAGVGNFLFGGPNDIPVVADYNGDRKADIAIFRQ